MQKYHIILDEEEKKAIITFLQSRKWNIQSRARANVLLDLDESNGKRDFSLIDISERNGVSKVTVWNVCKRYIAGGLDAVLHRQSIL